MKPKEWWIAFDEFGKDDDCYKRYVCDKPFNNLHDREVSVHVIEYAAYKELVNVLKKIKGQDEDGFNYEITDIKDFCMEALDKVGEK